MLGSLGQDSSTVLLVVGLVPPDWVCFTTRRTHAMCRSTYRWVTLKEVRSVLIPTSHQQGDSKWTDTTAERCVRHESYTDHPTSPHLTPHQSTLYTNQSTPNDTTPAYHTPHQSTIRHPTQLPHTKRPTPHTNPAQHYTTHHITTTDTTPQQPTSLNTPQQPSTTTQLTHHHPHYPSHHPAYPGPT